MPACKRCKRWDCLPQSRLLLQQRRGYGRHALRQRIALFRLRAWRIDNGLVSLLAELRATTSSPRRN
jgi:hypothetical protein